MLSLVADERLFDAASFTPDVEDVLIDVSAAAITVRPVDDCAISVGTHVVPTATAHQMTVDLNRVFMIAPDMCLCVAVFATRGYSRLWAGCYGVTFTLRN